MFVCSKEEIVHARVEAKSSGVVESDRQEYFGNCQPIQSRFRRIREWRSLKEHIKKQTAGCRAKGRGRVPFSPHGEASSRGVPSGEASGETSEAVVVYS